ncbi:MAG: MYXO-CTERM sorting domain-containing protein [bacterium]
MPTCAALGLGRGDVRCGPDCQPDVRGCDRCGDGEVQAPGRATARCRPASRARPGRAGAALRGLPGRPAPLRAHRGRALRRRRPGSGEGCDGVGDQTCAALGFAGGALRCSPTCQVDTSGCEPRAVSPDAGVSPAAAGGDGGCQAAPGAPAWPGLLVVLALGRRRRR